MWIHNNVCHEPSFATVIPRPRTVSQHATFEVKAVKIPDIVASRIIVLFTDIDEGGLRGQSQVSRECHTEFSSGGVKGLVYIPTTHCLRE